MISREDADSIAEMQEIGKRVSKITGIIGKFLVSFVGFSAFTGFANSAIAKMLSLFETINR